LCVDRDATVTGAVKTEKDEALLCVRAPDEFVIEAGDDGNVDDVTTAGNTVAVVVVVVVVDDRVDAVTLFVEVVDDDDKRIRLVVVVANVVVERAAVVVDVERRVEDVVEGFVDVNNFVVDDCEEAVIKVMTGGNVMICMQPLQWQPPICCCMAQLGDISIAVVQTFTFSGATNQPPNKQFINFVALTKGICK
jgi:hypothetical protein